MSAASIARDPAGAILTLPNLQAGIQLWLDRWERDFHDAFYRKLHERKRDGLTPTWWLQTVDDLAKWRATRGQTKAFILESGMQRLSRLDEQHRSLLNIHADFEPNMDLLAWDELSGLFATAATIKPNMSPNPMFASKVCHFIFPGAFPVVDGALVGLTQWSYPRYWGFCRQQWRACERQAELIDALRGAMRIEPWEHYPWSTKVTELCLIGMNHGP